MSWQEETSQERLQKLRSELKQLQQKVTLAEAELSEMEASMRTFEARFDLEVGHYLETLALLGAEVEAYKSRIRQLRVGKSIGEGYQSVEDQYDEKWNAPRRRTPKVKPLESTAPITQTRLKKLYRKLARQYHPDLARTEEDRAYRTQKMAAVNEAYKAGSVVELEALAVETKEAETPTIIDTPVSRASRQPRTDYEMVQVLREEIKVTERRLFQVEDAIRNFHHRPLVEFALEEKLARRDGRDLLAEMAEELQRKIARKEAERDMIRAQFDSLAR